MYTRSEHYERRLFYVSFSWTLWKGEKNVFFLTLRIKKTLFMCFILFFFWILWKENVFNVFSIFHDIMKWKKRFCNVFFFFPPGHYKKDRIVTFFFPFLLDIMQRKKFCFTFFFIYGRKRFLTFFCFLPFSLNIIKGKNVFNVFPLITFFFQRFLNFEDDGSIFFFKWWGKWGVKDYILLKRGE